MSKCNSLVQREKNPLINNAIASSKEINQIDKHQKVESKSEQQNSASNCEKEKQLIRQEKEKKVPKVHPFSVEAITKNINPTKKLSEAWHQQESEKVSKKDNQIVSGSLWESSAHFSKAENCFPDKTIQQHPLTLLQSRIIDRLDQTFPHGKLCVFDGSFKPNKIENRLTVEEQNAETVGENYNKDEAMRGQSEDKKTKCNVDSNKTNDIEHARKNKCSVKSDEVLETFFSPKNQFLKTSKLSPAAIL